jgi:FAD/FMN-containing dehydrogenase
MGNSPSSPPSALQTCLASALSSRADYSFPTDAFYAFSAVKPYNTAFAPMPAAVTRPRTAHEVAAVVACAAGQGLHVQARGGGHSFADFSLADVVVDLVHFQRFEMDTTTWHATVGGGTLLGDLTQRLHEHGQRAMAHGTCPQVCACAWFVDQLTDLCSI